MRTLDVSSPQFQYQWFAVSQRVRPPVIIYCDLDELVGKFL